jgi:hypothetical protein
VASAWFARDRIAAELSSTYRRPATYRPITRIDWLTEMTGWPVCEDTRWAVRCRVPDSSVGMVGSGMSWTAARMIREQSVASTTAPSILASSRSPVAENSTSSRKPPVQSDSTSLS